MAAKKTKKEDPPKKLLTADDAAELIKDCRATVISMLADHLEAVQLLYGDVGQEGLKDDIEAVFREVEEDITLADEPEIKDLVKCINRIGIDDTDELLDICDPDEVRKWLDGKGCRVIKTESIADDEKLEEFLTTVLYPNLNDQQRFL